MAFDPPLAVMHQLIKMKGKNRRVENVLHQRQIHIGAGLTVSRSIAKRQQISGTAELARRSHNRSLSMGDHSWGEPRRKATTTPANPANATAICAAKPRASPGSIVIVLSDQANHGQPYAAIDMAARRPARASRSRCPLHCKRESRHHVTGCKTSRTRLRPALAADAAVASQLWGRMFGIVGIDSFIGHVRGNFSILIVAKHDQPTKDVVRPFAPRKQRFWVSSEGP